MSIIGKPTFKGINVCTVIAYISYGSLHDYIVLRGPYSTAESQGVNAECV